MRDRQKMIESTFYNKFKLVRKESIKLEQFG
jgi:hypothetical protein